jgi:hypothetical protein
MFSFTWNTPKISRTPPKIGKIWFYGVKSWFFTRNTPNIFASPSARHNFFKISLYVTCSCHDRAEKLVRISKIKSYLYSVPRVIVLESVLQKLIYSEQKPTNKGTNLMFWWTLFKVNVLVEVCFGLWCLTPLLLRQNKTQLLLQNLISINQKHQVSLLLWQSVLLVEETRENHRPAVSHWQTLSHYVVSSTPRLSGIQTSINQKHQVSLLFILSINWRQVRQKTYNILLTWFRSSSWYWGCCDRMVVGLCNQC